MFVLVHSLLPVKPKSDCSEMSTMALASLTMDLLGKALHYRLFFFYIDLIGQSLCFQDQNADYTTPIFLNFDILRARFIHKGMHEKVSILVLIHFKRVFT